VDSPELSAAITSEGPPDRAALQRFVRNAALEPGVAAVEVVGIDGSVLASAGSDDAIAFAELGLLRDGARNADLRVSTVTAASYAAEVQRLTKREFVLTRGDSILSATVTPPAVNLEAGETVDVDSAQGEFRAHLLELDADDEEALLLLGPRKEGGFLAIGGPTLALLLGFLGLGVILAYAISRTLTGLHSQVAEQAVKDPLTGLWNRRRMFEMLEREMLRTRRFGHDVSVLIIDIDNFKSINDEMGHLQGDQVLRTIAEIVLSTTRTIDVGARYGGDELALVLLETDAEGAMILAERLRERIHDAEVPRRGGGSMSVTVSIGAATRTDDLDEMNDLIEAADLALLEAKRSGKDRVRAAAT
jgi:diguanylate cyclase (GGDEF)-like protein